MLQAVHPRLALVLLPRFLLFLGQCGMIVLLCHLQCQCTARVPLGWPLRKSRALSWVVAGELVSLN